MFRDHGFEIDIQTRRWLASVFPAALVLGLSGCAVMSPMDCVTADWEVYGELDGSEGQPLSHMDTRAEACLKHAVRLDEEAYKKGREAGLLRFCSRQSGFDVGRNGEMYHDVCTGTGLIAFSAGHRRGVVLWRAIQQFRNAERAVSEARTKIDRLERAIDELEDLIDDEDTSSADRKKWKVQIRENEKNIRRLRNRVEDLIADRERARYELRNLEDDAVRDGFAVVRVG